MYTEVLLNAVISCFADALKAAFSNKRRTYRAERKKVQHVKSGQSLKEVYTGKWRFFGSLRFLDAVIVPADRSVSETFEETPDLGQVTSHFK